MKTRSDLSRITIDIPLIDHKRLKATAALLGKSMRELVLEAIESIEECALSDHIPNKKTLKSFKDIEEKKDLIKGKEAEAISKKLGI
ncbi:MAG: hypothetical protein NTX86_03355 [Candidatus Dependentiae bacterium]|nr:hypothetical protein [Candidatus Dependentiae bacterium]